MTGKEFQRKFGREGVGRGESEGVESKEKKEGKRKRRKEERHPQCTTGSQSPLSEDHQSACALRVRRLVIGFDVYSEWKTVMKKSLERKRKRGTLSAPPTASPPIQRTNSRLEH